MFASEVDSVACLVLNKRSSWIQAFPWSFSCLWGTTHYQYTTTVQSYQTATLDLTKQVKSVLWFNQLTLLEICVSKKKKKITLTILSAECDEEAVISNYLHCSQRKWWCFYPVLEGNRKNFGKHLEPVCCCTQLYLKNHRIAKEELCSSIDQQKPKYPWIRT